MDAARARQQNDALQVRQTVDQQVATARLMLRTATAQVQAANAGFRAAQEAYDLAKLRYDAGNFVAVKRLDALAALTRAQGAFVQAKARLVITRS